MGLLFVATVKNPPGVSEEQSPNADHVLIRRIKGVSISSNGKDGTRRLSLRIIIYQCSCSSFHAIPEAELVAARGISSTTKFSSEEAVLVDLRKEYGEEAKIQVSD